MTYALFFGGLSIGFLIGWVLCAFMVVSKIGGTDKEE